MLLLGNAAANAAADATCALLNDGFLRLYAGGEKPGVLDVALGSQHVLLTELRFGPRAFEPADGGVAHAFGLIPDSAAREEGKATWFLAVKSDGVTPVFAGTVGTTKKADLVLNSVGISIGVTVSVASLTYQQPKG